MAEICEKIEVWCAKVDLDVTVWYESYQRCNGVGCLPYCSRVGMYNWDSIVNHRFQKKIVAKYAVDPGSRTEKSIGLDKFRVRCAMRNYCNEIKTSWPVRHRFWDVAGIPVPVSAMLKCKSAIARHMNYGLSTAPRCFLRFSNALVLRLISSSVAPACDTHSFLPKAWKKYVRYAIANRSNSRPAVRTEAFGGDNNQRACSLQLHVSIGRIYFTLTIGCLSYPQAACTSRQ